MPIVTSEVEVLLVTVALANASEPEMLPVPMSYKPVPPDTTNAVVSVLSRVKEFNVLSAAAPDVVTETVAASVTTTSVPSASCVLIFSVAPVAVARRLLRTDFVELLLENISDISVLIVGLG